MDDALEFYLERAAIMEYCGGMSRPDADFSAVCLTKIYCDARGIAHPNFDYFNAFSLTNLQWSDEKGKAVYVWMPPSGELRPFKI